MKPLLVTSLILFTISCCLPVLVLSRSNGPNDVMLGLRALAIGWSGVFAGVLAWYANPVWLLGLLLGFFRKPFLAALCGVVALGIAVTMFSVIGRELPGDEGNVTRMTVIRVLPGAYVWMASLAVLLLAPFFGKGN